MTSRTLFGAIVANMSPILRVAHLSVIFVALDPIKVQKFLLLIKATPLTELFNPHRFRFCLGDPLVIAG